MTCKSCKFWGKGWGMPFPAVKKGYCEKHLKNPSYPYCQRKEELKEAGQQIDAHIMCREVLKGCKKETFTCMICGWPVCSEHWLGQDCMARGMATNHSIPDEIYLQFIKRVENEKQNL